jgi:dihydrofolate reductase
MGRKTWDSIPAKFRPLKGRLNIVISRSFPTPAHASADSEGDLVKAASLEQALEYLKSKSGQEVGKVFVIGGGQIYDAALKLSQTRRLLITRILSDFECDTFFPLKVAESEECAPGWVVKSKADLDAWVGEDAPAGIQEENQTKYEFQMWERTE